MSTSKHTPTPYLADGGARIQGNSPGHMYDVAYMARIAPHINNEYTSKATAKFIVRACNAFPQLVEAAGLAENYMTECEEHGEAWDDTVQMIRDKLRAALAAAKEGGSA